MRAWGIGIIAILVGETVLAAGRVDFSRYEVILARKPFGEPPAEVAASPVSTPAAAAFIKDIRMCVITETPEFGIKVGFVDIAAKKNYYLGVGDTSDDGIQLVDADYEKAAALLRKGPDSFWINMSGQNIPGSGNPTQFSAAAGVATVAAVASATQPTGYVSYAERVKKRRAAMEERRRRQEEENRENPPPTSEEKDKALKEYQMELIRAGGEKGPVLPIPLTREMDDQLVAEGVLPSLDESGAASGENAPPVDDAPALELPPE